jgi:hypothetical protein
MDMVTHPWGFIYIYPSIAIYMIYISSIPWVWIYRSLFFWIDDRPPGHAYATQLLTRGTYEKRKQKKKLAGWWYTYPSEKYESQFRINIPIYYGKNNPNVPNHQPASFFHLSPQHSTWHSI